MAVFLAGFPASATTLQPLTGDEQIQRADAIFRGRVERIDARRDWSKPQGPVISTVQFVPLAVYKGHVSNPMPLEFLGGTAEGVELKVEGMPQFQPGQEYVLFVSGRKNVVCPVVGWTEGQLKIERPAGGEGSVAVSSTAAKWLERAAGARSRSRATSRWKLPEFESLLRARITQAGGSK